MKNMGILKDMMKACVFCLQEKEKAMRNVSKNKSGSPQTSLQCQMTGNNKVMPINVEGKRGYSKNSMPRKVGIYGLVWR